MAIITQDGNYTVKLYNSNGSVISDNYKLSQIIADLIASGYDCNALTLHQYSSYGYGSLMAFKITETGLYYVGDNDLKSGLGRNATLFQKDNITFNQHYYTYTSGSPVDRGVVSLGTQTINGLEYYYDYDGNVANEPIIYVDSSISLVVNDMLSPSGGAGSGYIGNSLLSNKKMVGYNVHISSEESTKTESVNEASESPVSGKPKIGNGHARIKLIREAVFKDIRDIAKNNDFANHYKTSSINLSTVDWPNAMSDQSSYYGTDWCIEAKNSDSNSYMIYENGVFKNHTSGSRPRSAIMIPLNKDYIVRSISAEVKIGAKTTGYDNIEFCLCKYANGNFTTLFPSGYTIIGKKPIAWEPGYAYLCEVPADSYDYNTVSWVWDTPVQGVNYIEFMFGETTIEMKNLKLEVL